MKELLMIIGGIIFVFVSGIAAFLLFAYTVCRISLWRENRRTDRMKYY